MRALNDRAQISGPIRIGRAAKVRAFQERSDRLFVADFRVRQDPEELGEARLGIEIDQQHPIAAHHQVLREMRRGRGLGDAALEIAD